MNWDAAASNAAAIEAEIAWFLGVLDLRFMVHAGRAERDVLGSYPAPALDPASAYGAAVAAAGLSDAERLILILALLPQVRPHALDSFLIENQATGRPFTEFGGVSGHRGRGFIPTRETALFLLAGEALAERLAAEQLFDPEARLGALDLVAEREEGTDAGASRALFVTPAWYTRLTAGHAVLPRPGPAFPATVLQTGYEWYDLVISPARRDDLEVIVTWMERQRELLDDWGLRKHLKPGYRALFHGPPGTGKTLAVTLLGQRLGLPVYRIDLSRVVSKWIGETEKNLASLFDAAAASDLLLFFDEADALFGKRGDTRSANDRHANQQISYLLQRIEDSPGLIILASNLRANIDSAFARRFQSMVHFPKPDKAERLQLWERAFAGLPGLIENPIDFRAIAREFEITGGAIINVLRSASIEAIGQQAPVTEAVVRRCIARELAKEGRLGI